MNASRSKLFSALFAAGLLALGVPAGDSTAGEEEPEFTTDYRIEDCRFVPYGKNPFFLLQPGYQLRLEGEEDGEDIEVVKTVLRDKEVMHIEVNGHTRRVRTRVLLEEEWADGEQTEVSWNYYSVCRKTGDVFYFGEKVDNYEDGEVVDHEGSWRADDPGATPGIIMPGTFLLGARYHQELAPGVAEDRAEHTAMGLDVDVPAGSFSRCVGVTDTNPLEEDSEGDEKIFCPRIGLVVDEVIELVDYGFVDTHGLGH